MPTVEVLCRACCDTEHNEKLDLSNIIVAINSI